MPRATEETLIRKATETGLWGASVPIEMGGAGLGTLATCLIEEELAQTIVPFSFGDVTPILYDCTGPQKQRYLVPALNRERTPYLALAEPSPRPELPDMGMTARAADGSYSLNGVKTTFGRPSEDYFAIVFAMVVPTRLPTCFLVDAHTAGFTVQTPDKQDRSSVRVPLLLTFDDCLVPAANRLGEEGAAFALGKKLLPARRVVRGARSVGVAQRLLEEATLRAQTWLSFGRPVGERPDVQAALAEAATDVHACRLLVYEAAWKADRGENVRREASMVKVFATRMVRNVADRVAHIYGGPPHADVLMERLCQDDWAGSANGPTTELQQHIIARDVLKGLKF